MRILAPWSAILVTNPQRRSRTVFVNSRSGIASSTGISWVIAMSNVYSSDRIRFGGVYSLKPCFEVCLATSKVPEFAQSFMASFSKEDGLQIWSRDRACHLDWRRLVSGSRFWHYGKPECRYRSQLQYAQRCDNWSGKPRQTKRCACSWRLRLAWCQLNYCWWRSFRQRRSRCTEHLC